MQVTLRELIHEYDGENRPHIKQAGDLIPECKLISECSKEILLVFYLDTKHRILAREIVSVGIINASLIHPREVFRSAVHINAESIIMVHNHPSGEPELSSADIEITQQIQKAGETLGIELLDHIVVAGDKYKSWKEAQ
jgi:DNA repair protein RadC